jgi:transcriptional regulator with XRE-family HTH domain
LNKHRITAAELAREVEVSKASLSRYISGDRIPSIIVAERIMRASNWEICLSGILSVFPGYEFIRDGQKDEDLL